MYICNNYQLIEKMKKEHKQTFGKKENIND